MEQNAQLSSDKDSLMLKLSKLEDEMKKLNTELTEEVMALVSQANMATEANTELKQMNGELAKEIARQQAIIHNQTVSQQNLLHRLNLVQQTNEEYLEKIHQLDTKLESHIEELSKNQARLEQLQVDQDGLREDLSVKDRHLQAALRENERLNELIEFLGDLKNSKLLALKNKRLEEEVCGVLLVILVIIFWTLSDEWIQGLA